MARQQSTSLVSQSLLSQADVVSLATASLPLRAMRGIYFLVANGEIVYVGQSVNVVVRVGQHVARFSFDSVAIAEIPAGSMAEIERSYIRAFLPRHNLQDHPGRARATRPSSPSALTPERIQRAPSAVPGTSYYLMDSTLPGFGVRVGSQSKRYVLRYRRRPYTLAPIQVLSLEDARDRAIAKRKELEAAA